MSQRPHFLVLALLTASTCLAGCSGGAGQASTSAPASPPSATGFPLSITNCGHSLNFTKPPAKIVSLNQGSTEIQLSLGLAHRMVGTATWTDDVLKELEEANRSVPRLADKEPSMEAVLAKEPELVTASFTYLLTNKSAGSFDKYASLGVPAYISPTDCSDGLDADKSSGDGARKTKFTMDEVYQEINDLARINGVPERGKELVDKLSKRLHAVPKVSKPGQVKVMYWFANSEAPYVAGGTGASQFVSDQLGVTNVYADQKSQWPQVSWEDIAAKNPDVIVLGDLTRKSQTAETGAAKIAYLEKNPVTAQMSAVKNHRYILVKGGDMNPSIRTVGLAEKLSAGLTKFGLA